MNALADGGYGWPFIVEQGRPNPERKPEGMTHAGYAKQTRFPDLLYVAPSAPMRMACYTGASVPEPYRGSAFAAMPGSWNCERPSGYRVVRVRFENDRPVAIEDFLTGFLADGNKGQIGRPVGVAVHNDGSLLVTDDLNGVGYTGGGESREHAPNRAR